MREPFERAITSGNGQLPWMLFSTDTCRDAQAMHTYILSTIAANEVANRPGRIEPRVLKRRRHRYPLMQRPRKELREKLEKT